VYTELLDASLFSVKGFDEVQHGILSILKDQLETNKHYVLLPSCSKVSTGSYKLRPVVFRDGQIALVKDKFDPLVLHRQRSP
jgi:hypothetical protein